MASASVDAHRRSRSDRGGRFGPYGFELISCYGWTIRFPLTELELELLELISMVGEPTAVLDEGMLESCPGRATVAATLRDLLGRGLLAPSEQSTLDYPGRLGGERVYEADWWKLTRAGRAAIGLKPRGDDRASIGRRGRDRYSR